VPHAVLRDIPKVFSGTRTCPDGHDNRLALTEGPAERADGSERLVARLDVEGRRVDSPTLPMPSHSKRLVVAAGRWIGEQPSKIHTTPSNAAILWRASTLAGHTQG
jgi:hypothetical protein